MLNFVYEVEHLFVTPKFRNTPDILQVWGESFDTLLNLYRSAFRDAVPLDQWLCTEYRDETKFIIMVMTLGSGHRRWEY